MNVLYHELVSQKIPKAVAFFLAFGLVLCYNTFAYETFYELPHGRRRNRMKQGIHPKYNKIKVTCSTCGNTFETGSTQREIRVDTCANCHPFFTGTQKFTTAAGRIDKFNKRYGMNEKK